MTTFTLILNSNNVVPNTNNNQYQFRFLNGNFTIKQGSEICVSSIVLPYAWFNISANYGNNTFSFQFPRTGGYTTFTVIIPDGFYAVSDVNNYLQQVMITNGLYLINASGQYVYYMVFAINVNAYANQVLFYPVPTSLPTGYTQPSNWIGYNTSSLTPILTIPTSTTSYSFGQYLGFSASTYGGGLSSVSVNSNLIPLGSIVNNVVVRCSIVDNNVTMPSDITDSIPINATFGSNINYTPNFEKWVSVKGGTYNSITVTFTDQNFNTIYIKDPNAIITLVIKNSF